MIFNILRRLDRMFPGYFAAAKHNHYHDFGYPDSVEFSQLYAMYTRNGIAHAAVEKMVMKTWQDTPFLLEYERDSGDEEGETRLEEQLRRYFDDIRFWSRLRDADRMFLVGGYSGILLSLRDNARWDQPVDTVPGGIEGLAKIIPVWAGQLTVSEWDTDINSPRYGEPKMYQLAESAVGDNPGVKRQSLIHPDRVFVWSGDGTVHGRSLLEAGYNDLMTMEKVSGAGGEGFWKNAKSSPILEVDPQARIEDIARSMGVDPDEIADKMDEQIADWQKGFDQMLMLQGIKAHALGITLPQPGEFFNIALQSFAASVPIPQKILVGMQTGERASTEDAHEWAQTNMARRNGHVIPNIMDLVNRLERFGILPENDWYIDWTDLTETSMEQKIDRADKMASVNQKMKDSGELIFTPEEIRGAVDYEPLTDAQKFREDLEGEEEIEL